MNKLLTLALLLSMLPAWGAVYKWVDESGRVHYTDQPPPGGAKRQETVTTRKPATAPTATTPGADGEKAAATGPKSVADQEMEFRKRRLEAAEAEAKRQKEAEAAEEKKRNCSQARNRLASLENGGRVSKYGPNGEIIYLSDAEIAREVSEARKVADSWCN